MSTLTNTTVAEVIDRIFYIGSRERSSVDKAKTIAADYTDCVLWAVGMKYLLKTNALNLSDAVVTKYSVFANEQIAFVFRKVLETLCEHMELKDIAGCEINIINQAKYLISTATSQLNTDFMMREYRHLIDHPWQDKGNSWKVGLEMDGVIRDIVNGFEVKLSTVGNVLSIIYHDQWDAPMKRLSFSRMSQIRKELINQLG